MRLLLALLTLSLAIPATAAVPRSKSMRKSVTAKPQQDDFASGGTRAPANASTTRARVAPAATIAARPVSIVPLVGMTLNSISGLEDWIKDSYNTKNYSVTPDTGFTVGALADVEFGSATTVIESGLAYTQLNQKFSIEKNDQAFVLNYLSVPLQGKTYLRGGRSGLFFNYGLNANFILGATAKSETNSQDIKDKMTAVNFTGALGLGYALPLNGRVQGMAGVAFNRSLNKINSEGDTSLYHNTFLFNLGVIL